MGKQKWYHRSIEATAWVLVLTVIYAWCVICGVM